MIMCLVALCFCPCFSNRIFTLYPVALNCIFFILLFFIIIIVLRAITLIVSDKN